MSKNIIDVQTEHINYTGVTGEIHAYLAKPKGEEKFPGVVIIHENQGLRPHFEDVSRRIASEGFTALVPDALSPLGGTPKDPEKAAALTKELDDQSTLGNFVAAVKYLRTHPSSTGKVAVMGFCWGGRMTNRVAVNDSELTAAVPFYGQQPASNDVPKIKASLLLHYGGLDEKINAGIPAFETALKEASKEYRLYIYEGAKHAFFNDQKSDRYNPEAADLAWQRTLSFLTEKLKS